MFLMMLIVTDIDAGMTSCIMIPRSAVLKCWVKYVSSPIHTYCVGQACSMGSLLLAAGAKGKRHALPNSSIMIHRAFFSIDASC